jgi:hypothetical protein
MEVTIILSNTVSNSIFTPGQCETCKCFSDLLNSKNAVYRYNCLVKEGDKYCDVAQSRLSALMESEGVTSLEVYIKKLKEKKYENRKNI